MNTPETITLVKPTISYSDISIEPKQTIINSAAKFQLIFDNSEYQNITSEKVTSDDIQLSEAETFESILMIKGESSEYEELINNDEQLSNYGEPQERMSINSQYIKHTEDLHSNSNQESVIWKPYITEKGSRLVFYHKFL